ncbi:hypothetical protein DPMN_025968 [Dreissena polymorpha]|uniref:Uncharacterized protein n=1 Tax=Dreissena polymorpha TaxID=45954 RepID=A0A9D4LSJ6_DREPO|nr:hypothetical protein DPMN_025968 [Dreissena polymorpha]
MPAITWHVGEWSEQTLRIPGQRGRPEFYQQEISSAYGMKNLVTVHPSVAFYTCPDCRDTAKPVIDVLVFLSDDTNQTTMPSNLL